MNSTPYSSVNQSFSNACHLLAQKIIYPRAFGVFHGSIVYQAESVGDGGRGAILDGEMAVDRILQIECRYSYRYGKLKSPIGFTVQERFRRPKYKKYDDITITEWNSASNKPSELYKMNANYFVYGFGNDDKNPSDLFRVIVINVPSLLSGIVSGRIDIDRDINPRSKQMFITVSRKELRKGGCVHWEQPETIS